MSKKGKGFIDALEGLGIIETDGSPSEPEPQAPTSIASPTIPTVTTPSASMSASADADMVAKIRAAVTATTHAPRLTSFLANREIAKQAFPSDERAAVSAALAFSKLTSADIRDELTKSVAAALLETEQKIKADFGQQREQVTTDLDTEAERHRNTISSLEEQIKTLQSQLGNAQAALLQIDSTRAERTTAITSRESAAFASLAAVKAELTSINNLLP
jgi:hypothetical protein